MSAPSPQREPEGESRMAEVPLVDTHFHIYTNDLPFTDTAWHRPTEDAPVERQVKTLDEHGVAFGVIAAASLQGTYLNHIRAALRRYKRLRSSAILDPRTDIHQMERMKAEGFVGVRLVLERMDDPPDLASQDYRAFFRRIADLDWHVHILDRDHRLPAQIAAIEGQGPKLVLDHFARPHPELGVDSPGFKAALAAIERGRTWVKVSAGYRMNARERMKELADALYRVGGAERLVWGSDSPFAGHEDRMSYAEALADFEYCFPDPAVRRRIGGETPMRLYFT